MALWGREGDGGGLLADHKCTKSFCGKMNINFFLSKRYGQGGNRKATGRDIHSMIWKRK